MIVPGSVNPLLIAQQGDPIDELGKIDRSIRMRAAAAASFTRVFGAPTNNKKWTFSTWVKRAKLAAYQGLLDAYSNGSNFTSVMFDPSDKYWFNNTISGSTASSALSDAVYRDGSSHLHVQIAFDSDNVTAADRCILWVNGSRLNITGSTPLGQTSYLNASGFTHSFGRRIDGNYNFDGLMSQGIFVDGQALPPSAFAQTHPRTGQWRPKSKAAIRAAVAAGGGTRNGWGLNGSFLTMDDPTSLTTLGYDRSQSDTDTTGNNWTASNISLTTGATYDSMLDTPTTNYCVLNVLANGSTTVSNGALEITGSTTGAIHGSQIVPRDYPVYFEVENVSTNNSNLAIGAGVVRTNVSPSANYQISGTAGIDGWYSSNGPYAMKDNGTSQALTTTTAQAGDVIQVAINGNNGWVGKNDVWFDSAGGTTGNPATGANPTFTLSSAFDYVPYVHAYANTAKANFGQRAWSKTCPSGFKAISQKNTTKPANQKASASVVVVQDSGANIQATLAAARAGWTSYIEIFKRRDAIEGWRWRFSDDLANYLDSNTTAAKAAFPALTGSSYVGYALKVAAANGVATGRLVHVNGVADTVADGLSTAQKMVLLKNESTGSWYWYHPFLTAGKLLYLDDATIGETTDATINTVTSSGFSVAAALASGTYRWIVFAETPGTIHLGGFTTNGIADGPFMNAGLSPSLAFFRLKSSGDLPILDSTRNPVNLANSVLYLDGGDGETASSTINNGDLVSNGFKSRCASSGAEDINYLTGGGAIYVAFGQPSRYANAR